MSSLSFGATPLPVSSGDRPVHVTIDVDTLYQDTATLQQPQTSQIAAFDAQKLKGQSIEVNQKFLLYALKNGLVRVYSNSTDWRSLLRGHTGQILQDMRFFRDGDILGTVATSETKNSILIWRVQERSLEIQADILLELQSRSMIMFCLIWHPIDPNQFFMVHMGANGTKIATLVETTKINTSPSLIAGHATCEFWKPFVIMERAIQLSHQGQNISDLNWSDRDPRYVLASFNTSIVLYDLEQLSSMTVDGTVHPIKLSVINTKAETPLSRCFFVPYEAGSISNHDVRSLWTTCFISGCNGNSELTLWSPFGASVTPSKIQVIELASSSSGEASPEYLVEGCFRSITAPGSTHLPNGFLLVANTCQPRLLSLHCKSSRVASGQPSLIGCDYVVPFTLKDPIYSMKCIGEPTNDIIDEDDIINGDAGDQGSGGFDVKVYAYQSKNSQCLTLTSNMNLPPRSSFHEATPGIAQATLLIDGECSGIVSDSEYLSDQLLFDEEYKVDDDDDDDDVDDFVAPDPSSLPSPERFLTKESGLSSVTPISDTSLANNPFANWLGAIAAKSSASSDAFSLRNSAPSPYGSTPSGDAMTSAAQQRKSSSVPRPPTSSSSHADQNTLPQSLLSPLDILGLTKAASPRQAQSEPSFVHADQTAATSSAHDTKNRKPPSAAAVSAVSILSRTTPKATAVKQSLNPSNTDTKLSLPSSSRNVVENAEIRSLVDEQIKLKMSDLESFLHATLQESLATIHSKLDLVVVQQQQQQQQLVADVNGSSHTKSGADPIIANAPNISIDPEVLTLAVEAPLRAIVTSHIKDVWIPAVESLTSLVLEQVSTHMEEANRERNTKNSQEMEAISTQLSTMTALVTQLTSEVQSLRTVVTSQLQQVLVSSSSSSSSSTIPTGSSSTHTAVSSSMIDPIDVARNEIVALLRESKYEAAFHKAVTTGTDDMASFCCAHADVQVVLGGKTPTISQPILLCLMQQLGTSLISLSKHNVNLELTWLQEIALCIDPIDARIQPHVSGVLQQMVTGINHRMKQQNVNDPTQRRSLQRLLQLVRGMQMG